MYPQHNNKKITNSERKRGIVQVTERLPSKYKALSSNSCSEKKEMKQRSKDAWIEEKLTSSPKIFPT
jgi:Zn-dependent M32 family carboxypeptidase